MKLTAWFAWYYLKSAIWIGFPAFCAYIPEVRNNAAVIAAIRIRTEII